MQDAFCAAGLTDEEIEVAEVGEDAGFAPLVSDGSARAEGFEVELETAFVVAFGDEGETEVDVDELLEVVDGLIGHGLLGVMEGLDGFVEAAHLPVGIADNDLSMDTLDYVSCDVEALHGFFGEGQGGLGVAGIA